jgi:hypothetical protein
MAVSASSAWELLVDTQKWSQWGPSVRAVELKGGRLSRGSHGRVQTPFGVPLLAGPYVLLCEAALRRIEQLAMDPATR